MTKTVLLDELKKFQEFAVKDMVLPVRQQEQDQEAPKLRVPAVYSTHLPDSAQFRKKAPYIINQVVTGRDQQPSGQFLGCECVVRSIYCVYSDDEQEGGLMLLELMERVRIELLKSVLIGLGQFELDLETGIECFVYPDVDVTKPYYGGEMTTTWKMPPVQRRIPCLQSE